MATKTKKTLFGKTIKSQKFDSCDRYDARLQWEIQNYRKIYMSLFEEPEMAETKNELEALTDAQFYYYIMLQRIY